MKSWIQNFFHLLGTLYAIVRPPLRWRAPVMVLLGAFLGLGLVVIYISRAYSYASDAPEVCMNCHIMAPYYATWERGSHGKVTTCLDCHVPHNNIIRQYFFKGQDGSRHAFMFTFRMEPQVIRIKEAGMGVVQENCIRCHAQVVHATSLVEVTLETHQQNQDRLCWDCHREIPHGRVNSLASTPYARVPTLSPVAPLWLEQYLKQTTSGRAINPPDQK